MLDVRRHTRLRPYPPPFPTPMGITDASRRSLGELTAISGTQLDDLSCCCRLELRLPILGQKPPGTKPLEQNPPDQNPQDKTPLEKNQGKIPRTKPIKQNPLPPRQNSGQNSPHKTLLPDNPPPLPSGQNPLDKPTPPPPLLPRIKQPHPHKTSYKTPRTQTTTTKQPRINPRSPTKHPKDKNPAKSKMVFFLKSDCF